MVSLPIHPAESVIINAGIGIQVNTIYNDKSRDEQLLEWASIKDVLIMEGAHRLQFIFFMIARLKGDQSHSIVFFPVPHYNFSSHVPRSYKCPIEYAS